MVPLYLDVEGMFPECPYDSVSLIDEAGQELSTCGSPFGNQPLVNPSDEYGENPHSRRMYDVYRMAPVVAQGEVVLVFHSDESVSSSGFALSYAAVQQ